MSSLRISTREEITHRQLGIITAVRRTSPTVYRLITELYGGDLSNELDNIVNLNTYSDTQRNAISESLKHTLSVLSVFASIHWLVRNARWIVRRRSVQILPVEVQVGPTYGITGLDGELIAGVYSTTAPDAPPAIHDERLAALMKLDAEHKYLFLQGPELHSSASTRINDFSVVVLCRDQLLNPTVG